MSDTSGLPSAIGIEAVEWLTDDPAGLTVRITGRWRRRRPEWRGPAMLVIEAEGRRHRIPAMPEPPFLIGLLPGMWRMSFSIPSHLADHLEGGTWLALGAVMVPITLARPGPAQPPPPPADPGPAPAAARPPVDRELLAQRELRSLELAADSARRRAQAADELAGQLREQIVALQDEVTRARDEPARLHAVIQARERALRAARQEVHAEAARRSEREAQLADQERDLERLRGHAQAMAERQAELERDLRRMRRAVDEAQRQAMIAYEAQAPPARARHDLRTEFALAARAPRPVGHRGPSPTLPVGALADERAGAGHPPHGAREAPALAELRLEHDALAGVLERERGARQAAEHRVQELEADLERTRERARRALAAIEAFRRELATLRAAPPPEPRAVARAEVPAVPQPPSPAPVDTPFEPDRLSAALARLREQRPAEAAQPAPEPPAPAEPPAPPASESTAPPAPEPPAPDPDLAASIPEPSPPPHQADDPDPDPGRTATTDALPRLFRALLRDDPVAAGRLVLALLPAQHRVHPRPLAYDLVLGPAACVQVTAGAGVPDIAMTSAPRSLNEVQFRIEGDPAALARLLAAGRLAARLRRGTARVHGERAALGALRALVSTPVSLDDLLNARVSLDPGLALRLVAQQVGTSLTEGFTIAHRPGPGAAPDAVLHAAAGRRPDVIEASLELPATTTIICPPDALMAVLAGRAVPGASIRGEARPLALLRRALQRA